MTPTRTPLLVINWTVRLPRLQEAYINTVKAVIESSLLSQ